MSAPGKNVLVIDSGADMIKIGLGSENAPRKFRNCVFKPKNSAQLFISNEVENLRDRSSLYYLNPKQNGYTLNWDVQRTIYEHLFYDTLNLNCSEITALVTQPELDPQSNGKAIDEIFFEDYGFKAIHRTNNSSIVAERYQQAMKVDGCVIVESGHSFTHIIPYWKGQKLKDGLMRIDVGGKLLTNYLKELVSYRQLNLMDEYLVCQEMKEKSCFCSLDFKKDMQKKEDLKRNYILPNFSFGSSGRMTSAAEKMDENEQFIKLGTERFQVPELLFNPTDTLINQMGLCDSVHEAILKCEEDKQPILYRNIMAMGGNVEFKNFRPRLLEGIRRLANDEYDVRVGDPKNPSQYAWVCAAKMSRMANFKSKCVTREQWMEEGSRITERTFLNI